MTEKLYYQDVYRKEFTAKVEEMAADDGTVLVRLDRTAFYPEGGGQGADQGTMELSDGTVLQVIDVQEKEGAIWHTVSYPAAEPGNGQGTSGIGQLLQDCLHNQTELKCCIDWDRRFDHMQQHSGEHIVSGMICRKFHCDNVGFHMGEDLVTVDFNVRITMEEAEQIEREANTYIWEDHPMEILWPSEEELQTLEYRSKKELHGDVRIARFPGADCCACCGTHVSGSAQVGLVKFLSAKNFHEGTRLELLCGKRAMEFLARNYQVNKAAAVLLSTSEENTAEYVKKLQEENMQLKVSAQTMETKLFQMWAESFRDKGHVLVIDDTLNGVQGRNLADLIADCCGGLAAVFAGNGDHYQYAVIQKGGDIGEMIRSMNQALNGRGGGRNGFAQGSVNAGKKDIQAYFRELGAEISI